MRSTFLGDWRTWGVVVATLLVLAGPAAPAFAQAQRRPTLIAPPDDEGVQYVRAQIRAQDAEADAVMRVITARTTYMVDGTGLTVAVMDTGLRTTHVDFAGKVVAQQNFTTDDGGNPLIVTDGNGHGTNVAGITCGNGIHVGIAPGAKVVPLKVLANSGSGSFSWLQNALDWVIANKDTYKISVVNMSLGSNSNYNSDNFGADPIQQRIATLRAARVAVCIAAGNSFYSFSSTEGMSYPAIFRESISVGAVYDANIGGVAYGSGAQAFTTAAKRVTPFSQRLHPTTNPDTKTDVFATGAAMTAAGIANDTAESTFHGTSQATPATAGLVLLLQQFAIKKTGQLPTVDQLEKWLRDTAEGNTIIDGDDEDDNVTNTGKTFILGDAVGMLKAADKDLTTGPPPTPGNVTAVYTAGNKTLTLTGDTKANTVSVTKQGTNKIVVSGGSGTKINNGTKSFSFTVSGPFTIKGDLKDGNDSLSLLSLPLTLVDIKLGNGNDKAVLNYCTIGTSQIDGGQGTDQIVQTTSTITTNQNVNFP